MVKRLDFENYSLRQILQNTKRYPPTVQSHTDSRGAAMGCFRLRLLQKSQSFESACDFTFAIFLPRRFIRWNGGARN